VAHTKCVVLALTAFGKAAKSFVFPIGHEIVSATGEDLMPVCLMPHIPYQLIVRGVIDVMEGCSEFNNAEAGSEMSTMYTDDIDDILPKFIANLMKFFSRELFKVGRGIDGL
jgi:hypothetical protein